MKFDVFQMYRNRQRKWKNKPTSNYIIDFASEDELSVELSIPTLNDESCKIFLVNCAFLNKYMSFWNSVSVEILHCLHSWTTDSKTYIIIQNEGQTAKCLVSCNVVLYSRVSIDRTMYFYTIDAWVYFCVIAA